MVAPVPDPVVMPGATHSPGVADASGAGEVVARAPSLPPRALVVMNPVAPHADRARLEEILKQVFEARGGTFRVFETFPGSECERALDREIAQARADDFNLVIAAGGDGTVSLAANRLAASGAEAVDGSRMLLGIVPLGTANILAQELVIPPDLETAVAVCAERRRISDLDAMEVGGRRYLTQVGVGFDARMISDTSRADQQRLGRLAYFLSFLRTIAGHRASRFYIQVDHGRRLRVRAWQVVVANAGTFAASPFTWGPDIDATDGVLDICVYDVHTASDTVRLAWRFLTGRHRNDDNARFLSVREEVRIESHRPLPVQGDGELIGETPILLRVVRGVVSVVVPEAMQDIAPSAAAAEAAPPGHPLPAPVTTAATRLEESRVRANPQRRRVLAHIAEHVLRHRVSTVAAHDAALFLKINGLSGGSLLDLLMVGVSRGMDYGELWVALALVVGWLTPGNGGWIAVRMIGALWLTMLTVNYPIKAVFCRERPFIAYIKARVVGRKPSDSSFPSGHTAAAFAGAMLLTPYLPQLGTLFYAYAFLVALSRLYLGVHYPSDVVIGAGCGLALAASFRALLGWVLPGA